MKTIASIITLNVIWFFIMMIVGGYVVFGAFAPFEFHAQLEGAGRLCVVLIQGAFFCSVISTMG